MKCFFCCENENYNPKSHHCLSGGFVPYPKFSFNPPKIVPRQGLPLKLGKCPTKSIIIDEDVGCLFENCFDDSNFPGVEKCERLFFYEDTIFFIY